MTAEELELRLNRLSGLPPAEAEELRRAWQYIDSDPGASLTKSRIILEKLVLGLFQAETGKPPRKPELGELLNDNQFTRKLDRRIVSRMNSIRDMANLGAHGEPVLPEDARRVLEDLCAVLEWHRQRSHGPGPAGATAPAGRRLVPARVGTRVPWRGRLGFAAALVAFVALPPLASLVAGIGPPWPHPAGVAAFCALAGAACVLLAHRRALTREDEADPWRGTRRWFGLFIVSLVAFILLKSFFCYNAPSFANQVAGGFVLQDDMKDFLKDDPSATVETLLEEALYHPTRVWEPWSVYLVRGAILVSWVALFAGLAYPLASALFARKGPGEPGGGSPRRP
jgi:hypothetical protein